MSLYCRSLAGLCPTAISATARSTRTLCFSCFPDFSWETDGNVLLLLIFPLVFLNVAVTLLLLWESFKYSIVSSQMALVVKNVPVNAGDVRDTGSIPGSGWSSGEGHGNPLQYSCLENPVDRGAWWATVHRFRKSRTRLKRLHRHTRIFSHHVFCTSLDLTWYSNSLFLIPTVKFFPLFFILFTSFPPLFFQLLLRGEIGSLGLRLRLSLWWMEKKVETYFKAP